jgi:hypothetical protein
MARCFRNLQVRVKWLLMNHCSFFFPNPLLLAGVLGFPGSCPLQPAPLVHPCYQKPHNPGVLGFPGSFPLLSSPPCIFATRNFLMPELHCSISQAIVLNGDIFYSPNCLHDINPPPPPPNHCQLTNIFQRMSCLHHCHKPQWWTATFGYMSF